MYLLSLYAILFSQVELQLAYSILASSAHNNPFVDAVLLVADALMCLFKGRRLRNVKYCTPSAMCWPQAAAFPCLGQWFWGQTIEECRQGQPVMLTVCWV